MASASDNFNRADNLDLGANWDSILSSAQIVGNEVRVTTAGSAASEVYNAFSPTNDQECRVTIVTNTGTNAFIGATVRSADTPTNTHYHGISEANAAETSRIRKIVAGVVTQLATENATTWVAGDVVTIGVVGTALTLYRNGTSVLTATDGDIASGKGGLYMFNDSADLATVELDTWEVTDGSFSGSGGGIGNIPGNATQERRGGGTLRRT